MISPPGRPPGWPQRGIELARWQWRTTDLDDPVAGLTAFLDGLGIRSGARRQREPAIAVVLLAGADGCAALAGLPPGSASPSPVVPDLVAVAVRPDRDGQQTVRSPAARRPGVPLNAWRHTWTDEEHRTAVDTVRQRIARGDVYQVNLVGHRCARHREDPAAIAAVVAKVGPAAYGGVLAGEGWAVGSASPEQLVRVVGDRVTTVPVKGTRPAGRGAAEALRRSEKDRAEHVMIVDLERNDLGRVAVPGTVDVQRLYQISEWAGLLHAGSVVAARLEDGVGPVDLLRAVVPGGSVTGAPKRAACSVLTSLEPVGRGPSMGAFGMLWPGGMDLGLTIRTVAVDDDTVHLWAGGGITWGSDPAGEVAEAHAKAAPLVAALAGPGRLAGRRRSAR